jgi:hypothetical protein
VCSPLVVRNKVIRRWINSEQEDNSCSSVNVIEFSDRYFGSINELTAPITGEND